ncbi:hypothetical protein ARS67_002381 [Listeria monocytogenes]|nr:hypothetical protein [Listeria monocytogenes]EDN9264450.1 hypothetical protein [Listeria monocytogenes]EDN9301914.1 hypothetical protein [Listeria monocytogenes]EDN9362156.1 hypothetical protein [Listeria monocytogenes]EDN9384227.1 hypothetical protein [Listeria monocytogenes]
MMKRLIILALLFVFLCVAIYILYDFQLGSIPILLMAILFFYIGYQIVKKN